MSKDIEKFVEVYDQIYDEFEVGIGLIYFSVILVDGSSFESGYILKTDRGISSDLIELEGDSDEFLDFLILNGYEDDMNK